MNITYGKATKKDVEYVYRLCQKVIDEYENIESIDYDKVMKWVHNKIERSIDEYTVIYLNAQKAGYYHFYKNEDCEYELDDLYLFPEYQNQGIGSEVIQKCCLSISEPVKLYVFIKNTRAIALYKRLGFEILKAVNDTRYIMKRDYSKNNIQ